MNSEYAGRRELRHGGAPVGFAYTNVPENKKNRRPYGQIPPGYTDDNGEVGGMYMATFFRLDTWEILNAPSAAPPDPLLAEFWGPEIPERATAEWTRREARGREQARQESIGDTVAIAEFKIPETFEQGDEVYPVADNYVAGGAGTRAIAATMVDGNMQVRFTRGNFGIRWDNYDALPGHVITGNRAVLSGYQMQLLDAIEETQDLDLANLKDDKGANVLDPDGSTTPIIWMPTIAQLWIALRGQIKDPRRSESLAG